MESKRRKKGPLSHTNTEYELASDPGFIDEGGLRIDAAPAYHSDSNSMLCGGCNDPGLAPAERLLMADNSAQ